MKVERIVVKAHCKACQGATVFKLDAPLSKNLLPLFIDNGFTETTHFTKSGLLYIENNDLIATGAFGSDQITVKCKKTNCQDFINDFEDLLTKI